MLVSVVQPRSALQPIRSLDAPQERWDRTLSAVLAVATVVVYVGFWTLGELWFDPVWDTSFLDLVPLLLAHVLAGMTAAAAASRASPFALALLPYPALALSWTVGGVVDPTPGSDSDNISSFVIFATLLVGALSISIGIGHLIGQLARALPDRDRVQTRG